MDLAGVMSLVIEEREQDVIATRLGLARADDPLIALRSRARCERGAPGE
jgi:hypothetical protein